MLRPALPWLCLGLCSLLVGEAEAPSPVDPLERSRPYAVLRGQNLETTGERICLHLFAQHLT
uniref:Chromosome 12 open reading frame 76 n=1 Tax=Gorilla gorilla gorilla TaxID=9595 RepID=A0A2I2YB12_GORGO